MKEFIQKLLIEGLENGKRNVSRGYLKQLLNNTTNNLAKKYLNNWINKSNTKMVELSSKESNIFDIIKKGGILPKNFGSKN